MFRFEEKRSSENNWAGQCINKGRGPCTTRSGWLLQGKHEYFTLGNGIDIECETCHNRRSQSIWLPPDYSRPIIYTYLTEQERTQMRIGLAVLREAYPLMEAATLSKINDRRTK